VSCMLTAAASLEPSAAACVQVVRVRNNVAGIRRFTRSPVNFHADDGSGYQWLADSVLKVHTAGS